MLLCKITAMLLCNAKDLPSSIILTNRIALLLLQACPLCNLQISKVKKKHSQLTANGMAVISVMESTPDEMKVFAGTQVTDEFAIYIPKPGTDMAIYKDYGAQRSVAGSMMGYAPCWHCCYDFKFFPAMVGFGANPKFGCPLMNPKGFR